MAELEIRPDYSSAFPRQYKKLRATDQDLADAAIRDLVRLVNIPPNSEEAKSLARDRRVKVIQRFKKKKPKRMEATFAPDGRIVWALHPKIIYFIYIGNHSVLDKE